MQNQEKTQGLWTPRVAEDDHVGGEHDVGAALGLGFEASRALYWISGATPDVKQLRALLIKPVSHTMSLDGQK